ncbi:MAG: sugar ABC transporter permease [Candidatus Nanopelagicales bacterium]|nr:sugar ABC transporter permease [Candidatus Nanopelagicales bacterium]MCF8539354.1 sugar ABC transporter permease [Candidatus Nanopelagicales bacterium]
MNVTVASRRKQRYAGPVGAAKGLSLFSIPALAWFVFFTIGPLFAMFYISTLNWRSIIGKSSPAGIANYQNMLSSDVFYTSLINTIIQLALMIPIMIPMAFMVGYYLTLKPRGHRVLRVILFTPGLISISATAMVFYAALGPQGLVNGVLDAIGLEGITRPWLASTQTALLSIIAIGLWQGIGFTAVLFAARLESINKDLFEAAKLDGASEWRIMWRIAFPVSLDFVGTLTMLQFLWTLFSSAGLILLLTRGGPGLSTTTLSLLIYQKAFFENDLGYSQAVGVFLFLFGLIGMLVIRATIKARY